MRPFYLRLELVHTLAWLGAVGVVANQYTNVSQALVITAGAFLGCLTAYSAARRSTSLENVITLCPFFCALLLLACCHLQHSFLAGKCRVAETVVFAGTAFCASMALDLLRAEFPQARGIRIVLSIAGLARLPLHTFDHPLLLVGVLSLAAIALVSAKYSVLLGNMQVLRLQRIMNPGANS